ncbi:MAG: nucleoside triphosphate pyrophosphohydrolase [Fusobacteriaceae bacterium]
MTEFDKLVQLMKTLRGENGCSWDKKQTIHSLKEYLLEETYETLEAMDLGGDELKGELGDLLLNIIFQAQISEEKGEFNMEDVVKKLSEKLIRRHPHIFQDEMVELSPEEVKKQWENIKKDEKEHQNRKSILDGIPKALPPMARAEKIIKKVSAVGFDWDTPEGVLDKIEEELEEVRVELRSGDREKLGEELGDLMFSLINMARYLGYNSSDLLNKTNHKFERRFRHVEANCILGDADLEEMDNLWEEAKKIEKGQML